MANTTLLLNGFSIIGDPHTNTNAAQGGNLMVHNGDAVFESDDIIVFLVENVTVDGVLTGDSIVVGVVVYDNATEYYYDQPMFTYTSASGSGGDIGTGRGSMGDRYLQFDAAGLTSTDPGAPVLGELAVVAGVDILNTLATQNGPIRIPTTEDIDLNGDGVIDPDETGDGSFSSDINDIAVICFLRDTLIETPSGPRPIQSLAVGDLVNTLDDGPRPIRWIGSKQSSGRGLNAPIRICAGALGNTRDLWVSPNHRMLVFGAAAELMFANPEMLVAAKHLVNGTTIRQIPRQSVEYFHFLLDEHHLVFAEACVSESLFPGPEALETVSPKGRREILRLFPTLARPDHGRRLSRPCLSDYEAAALLRAA